MSENLPFKLDIFAKPQLNPDVEKREISMGALLDSFDAGAMYNQLLKKV